MIIVLVLLVTADRRGWLLVAAADDLATHHGVRAMVTRVIDGDTLEVDIPDLLHSRPTTRVRLWGIDCPEPARVDEPAEPWAAESAAFVRDAVEHQTVRLVLEPQRVRDAFGRVLAHIDLDDNTTLNARLLEAGLARIDGRWAHARLVVYGQLERKARRAKAGLWAEPGR